MLLMILAISMVGAGDLDADKAKNEDKITTVVLDNETGAMNPANLRLRAGHEVAFEIVNTNKGCYNFNFESVKKPDANAQRAAVVPHIDTVLINTTHRADISEYKVTVKKKPDVGSGCNREMTFTIPVETLGWRIAITGAFTGSNLTNEEYFLRSVTANSSGGALSAIQDPCGASQPLTADTGGFFVCRDADAEDQFSLGAASLIHIFHTDKKHVAGGGWVPISFGLGIGTAADTEYYLGTGFHLGEKFFLTVGGVFGSVDRLPSGVRIGDFTTNQGVINDLPTRTASAFFVGLSYSFLEVDRNMFTSKFKAQPAPEKEPGGAADDKYEISKVDPDHAKVGDTITITLNKALSSTGNVQLQLVPPDSVQQPAAVDATVESDTKTLKAKVPQTATRNYGLKIQQAGTVVAEKEAALQVVQ